MKKKKIKEIKPPMEFSVGLHKYEPVLPLIKTGKKVKFKDVWMLIIFIIIFIIIGIFALFVRDTFV